MSKELRRVWLEDRYRAHDVAEGRAYVGREKAGRYIVYAVELEGRRRRIIHQTVDLEQDWYWCASTRRLVAEAVEGESGWREEHFVEGYRWCGAEGVRSRSGLEDLSDDVVIHELKLSHAEATLYLPRGASRFLVSLHGGPESFEGAEIRYGGGYRDLLRAKIGIVVLNYAGSRKSDGAEVGGRRSWGSWSDSIAHDFRELMEQGAKLGLAPGKALLFGASFGGALALVLKNRFPEIRAVFLSSPLLDLDNQRRRGGAELEEWFASRFSDRDFEELSFRNLTNQQGDVHLSYGEEDEVLDPNLYARAPGWTAFRRSGGHVPVTYREYRRQKAFFEHLARTIVKA